jgi:hypothetical protein
MTSVHYGYTTTMKQTWNWRNRGTTYLLTARWTEQIRHDRFRCACSILSKVMLWHLQQRPKCPGLLGPAQGETSCFRQCSTSHPISMVFRVSPERHFRPQKHVNSQPQKHATSHPISTVLKHVTSNTHKHFTSHPHNTVSHAPLNTSQAHKHVTSHTLSVRNFTTA